MCALRALKDELCKEKEDADLVTCQAPGCTAFVHHVCGKKKADGITSYFCPLHVRARLLFLSLLTKHLRLDECLVAALLLRVYVLRDAGRVQGGAEGEPAGVR